MVSNDDQILIFNVEETLLKSSSLFPYFMLVAFEAGSPLRALILLVLYPLICLLGKEMGLKIMVFVSFFGIKKKGFMVGRAVLPKYFLEDVGLEGFEVVNKSERKVGVSQFPHVMVESFLREYLKVDYVVGKELKVFCGYFIGLMEDNKQGINLVKGILKEEGIMISSNVIGICGTKASLSHPLFAFCKEIFLTNEGSKRKWQNLPRENYPKPLIFHDGRLALKPTPNSIFALFIWLPFGTLLGILRALVFLTLPQKISTPILAFSGLRVLYSTTTPTSRSPSSNGEIKSKGGQLYVCNHRTLLDPLYLSYTLNKPVTAVTYSLSRMSEILAPIKTVRLNRDRDQDGNMMKELLKQGDLVVCPEGTTCREQFLLRFSPLFGEMSEKIVPVAMNSYVTMFHGTTASGLKCLDPLFFLMNPQPSYTVRSLDPVHGVSSTCQDRTGSRFDVANKVQREIGEALGFECTELTRKDKYMILAGNQGDRKSVV